MNWPLFRLVFAVVSALGVVLLFVLNFASGGGLLTLLLIPNIVIVATVAGLLAAALFPQRRKR
jgi:hypothetical protein